ncbi:YozE family protein [uncultured Enterococcus sp.]|uniref:YozE family protein n=1 Tax=uncultured Enterococcus sp. TaxID=167972 RepID=UPI0025DC1500|nr:YozE family protein [uncultured Enterococcus sp.]
MTRSFYHYVLTLRGALTHDPVSLFAQAVSLDAQFPKQSCEYDEISSYLELETDYVSSMQLFDEIWELYVAHNKK